jgi:hypothetical protein
LSETAISPEDIIKLVSRINQALDKVFGPHFRHGPRLQLWKDESVLAVIVFAKPVEFQSGRTLTKETAMTMLTNVPRGPMAAPSIRTGVSVLWSQFRRLVNRWVAAAIARRERQAELAAQRYFGSNEPGEFGVYRYRSSASPAKTAAIPTKRTEPS